MTASNRKNTQRQNSVLSEGIGTMNSMDLSTATSQLTNTVSLFTMPEKVVLKNADLIRGQLMAEIERGALHWTIDLRLTQRMDFSGLVVLIAVWKRVEKLGGTMVLVEPTSAVKALLESSRLYELFEVYEDINAATEYVKRQSPRDGARSC